MFFWRKREVQGTVLVLPYLVVFAMFVLVPLIATVVRSFMGDGLLGNYIAAFALPRFRLALAHTALYTVLASVLMLLLAFPTAYLLRRLFRGCRWLKLLLTMPYAPSIMGVSMIWLMFVNPQNGLINKLMPLFGLTAQSWLESSLPAFLCVLSLTFWRGFAFTLFNCVYAMESQPKELYEFAAISGANSSQMFLHITLPQLMPTLMYIIPTAMVSVLTTFEPVFLFNYAGMQGDVTNTLMFEFYRQANLGQPGVASAIAVIALVPIMLCCWAYMRYILGRKAAK